MIRKIFLYLRVIHRGELLKKIEYKFKDKIKYFNNRTNKDLLLNEKYNIKNKKINIEFNERKKEDFEYYIFGKKNNYDDLIFGIRETKYEYWRSVKINKYSDIKKKWELNRLQFLLPLSKEYIISKDNETKKKILEIIKEWDCNNNYEYSINWNSNLEVAIRTISLYITMLILNDYSYKQILFYHGLHLYNEIGYSEKCIPNNHVIGEAVALLMLSSVFDNNLSRNWYKRSVKILKKYTKSFDKYGISNENSFSYQFFVTKMYILSLCFVEDSENFNCFLKLIRKSLIFLNYTIVNKHEIFNYGDNDNGFLYSFDSDYSIVNDIKRYYDFFINNKVISSDFEILFYKKLLNIFNKKVQKNITKVPQTKYFLSDKIFIYNDDKISLLFNAKKIRGHAHNDSLAINLYIDGKEILGDSGTYSYNESKKLREFYRSREAHTTILSGDNAVSVASFRWINKEKSWLANFTIDGNKISIDGFLGKNVKRKIVLDIKNRKVFIYDYTKKKYMITSWIFTNKIRLNKRNEINCLNSVIIIGDDFENLKINNIKASKKYLCFCNAKQLIKKDIRKSMVTIKY